MTTTKVNNHTITQHRKNITKFVESLKDKAVDMIKEGHNLQDISTVLRKDVQANTKNTKIYVSFMAKCDWNKNDLLCIRDSSQDCTLVSIK